MSVVLPILIPPICRALTFTEGERNALLACAKAAGERPEAAPILVEFAVCDDGEEWAAFTDRSVGPALLSVITENGALALMLPGGAAVGPFADVASLVQAVHRRLGCRWWQGSNRMH